MSESVGRVQQQLHRCATPGTGTIGTTEFISHFVIYGNSRKNGDFAIIFKSTSHDFSVIKSHKKTKFIPEVDSSLQ